MAQATICILHPGEMGSAVARTVRAGGARVLWTSAGRGEATRKRADAAGLEDVGMLRDALRAAEFVLSVCPPHAAVTVAESVAAHGFRGIYIDANAVSPDTTRRVGSIVEAAGATFVDGGIVGAPPATGASTRLYLSGPSAGRVAELSQPQPQSPIPPHIPEPPSDQAVASRRRDRTLIDSPVIARRPSSTRDPSA